MTFFESIAGLCMSQLPLFIMLVIYSTAPIFFSKGYSYNSFLIMVLPQVILPSILLCLLASWRRWTWWIVFIFGNLLWLIEMGCLFTQQQRMWSYIGLLIAQSNPRESGEFLSTVYIDILKAMIVVAVSMSVIYICDRLWRKYSGNLTKKLLSTPPRRIIMKCYGFILSMSVIYSPVSAYAATKTFNPTQMLFTASTWTMYACVLNDTFNNYTLKALPYLIDTVSSTTVTLDAKKDSLTIVYVIGESFIRSRSSLYGYPINTNPLLGTEFKDSSLIIFDNIISPSQSTFEVYGYMHSTCNIQDNKPFEDYPLLPALMKKAGYKVSYLDNQSSIANGIGDFLCNYFFANEKLRDYCFDTYNKDTESYDAAFVEKNVSPFMGGDLNNFTIYHLMGQHSSFSARYPKSFTHFTNADFAKFEGLSEKGATTMAEYDNATLYNDFTIHTIINKLRDKNAILVYTSDHGEEVYDYREASGRGLNYRPIRSVRLFYEVPAMIWVSNSFKQKYPEIVSALRSNTHKAIYNSDLPHTILDIAGIMTETFNPDMSLLRDSKGRTHRHVKLHDIDYDAMHDDIYRQKMRYE